MSQMQTGVLHVGDECGNLETPPRPLSPVLRAITWTLLSSGILLALLFLAFTLRCRNNSEFSPDTGNINVHALRVFIPTPTCPARIWTLCIGISLVFGPILGKTWRLYRVFTQRVPDKRVIIRDIQLIGLVALLILADIVVLTTWSLTDPVQCIKSIRAAVQGSVLLYGTYLAGLTSNVSWPPVNQSLTIMAPVCLVTLSVALSIPVSRLLYSWPNVVYSVISGSIFICTLTTNCLLFVPQLTQWKQFEDESNPSSSQMAKFFSSPSKSLQSMYSEDEIFYLRGENDSMKRLLMEKNAVIDSLQEQVNSAKDKLLKLMSASSSLEHQEVGTSSTNLNSSFMQKDSEYIDRKSGFRLDDENYKSDTEEMECNVQTAPDSTQLSVSGEALMDVTLRGAGGCPPDNPTDLLPQVTTGISPSVQVTATLGGKCNFVSSEKLQEIILDLSVDAVSLRSPKWEEEHSSASLEEPSPKLSYRFYYPSISPYVMRRRRPPFRATRAGLPAYCYSLSLPHTGCKGAGDSKAEPDAIVSQPQQHNCCREQVAAATPAKLDHRGAPRRCTVTPFSGCDSRSSPIRRKCLLEGWKPEGDMYYYSDSESSSSDDDYCFYHRPYCNACSHGQYESMESTSSETSDSELGPLKNYRHVTHPVVNFKEDLKPTFV
ncbi:hypothetical protein Z043_103908 [Scleropages formosus]|uniref:G-protein coupled receptors family 3 profile domain-containing protein n=1 Tax=Scleropages formosus TaxID=113540 RepID=A0A0P7V2B4_SCLFO|nr:hypothetical protein Z043_103908 [Scleropages formosus]